MKLQSHIWRLNILRKLLNQKEFIPCKIRYSQHDDFTFIMIFKSLCVSLNFNLTLRGSNVYLSFLYAFYYRVLKLYIQHIAFATNKQNIYKGTK